MYMKNCKESDSALSALSYRQSLFNETKTIWILTAVDCQNTGKKSIQPTSTVYWISSTCAPSWGFAQRTAYFAT